jgi:hypothetical protein
VPYKDKEKQKAYMRAYAKRQRELLKRLLAEREQRKKKKEK